VIGLPGEFRSPSFVRRDWKDRPVPFPTTASAAPSQADRELGLLVGERTVPQLWHENYWFRRHEIAYLTLAPLVARLASNSGPTAGSSAAADSSTGADASAAVVEAGSGEGYGVRLLRQAGAERVIALDYDAASLAHARSAYPEDVAGRAVRTNLAALPLADAGAAVITCMQVIEHLWTPGQFLAEAARVLRPGGLLVVSTPNRLTFSPGLGRRQKPPNPFHCREFDADELRELIAEQFPVVDLLAVRHGPRLRSWAAEHGDPIAAQLATSPDAWPAPVRDLVRSVTAADFVLTPLKILDAGSLPLAVPQQQIKNGTMDDGAESVLDLVVLARRADR
jgi:SAM-dependent methyltransferase